GPTDGNSRDLDLLTDREREVLLHIARGLTNREIADSLYVGESTVKTHVRHILTKLDPRDRIHAVVLADETGLVAPRDPRTHSRRPEARRHAPRRRDRTRITPAARISSANTTTSARPRRRRRSARSSTHVIRAARQNSMGTF